MTQLNNKGKMWVCVNLFTKKLSKDYTISQGKEINRIYVSEEENEQ